MGTLTRLLFACGLAGLLTTGSALAHDPAEDAEVGIASYYGDRFQGNRTANGERFDQNQLTAAHPELPFGTTVVVTRQDTGQEVEVRINDRGPYARGRIIDLSKRAARELGMLGRGVAPVIVTQVN